MSGCDLQGIGMTSQRTRDRLVARLREQGITDEAVLSLIGSVPRHIFIDEAWGHRAYEDSSLPIGHGQTISQPFIVALMSQLLNVSPRQRVLEVGTGSGYQTAVLASLCERLFSVERIEALVPRAQQRFAAMKLRNITLRYGDGYAGWPEKAPFDGILVTAAPPEIPAALVDQLALGGRLIAPVGTAESQSLQVIDRTEDGLIETMHERVHFVPLVNGIAKQ
ncbi:MAG: protein-L-isoaspartate(D-aspartate) O-methyltransferase [Proteobacteria bacterium]|nr:protein-L-isoaspartate(D-aspartate) O-methyltransferase [Pseudomonadota bacterium]